MSLITLVWFTVWLLVVMAALRLLQTKIPTSSPWAHALAFILH
jgi:hypothetical protein